MSLSCTLFFLVFCPRICCSVWETRQTVHSEVTGWAIQLKEGILISAESLENRNSKSPGTGKQEFISKLSHPRSYMFTCDRLLKQEGRISQDEPPAPPAPFCKGKTNTFELSSVSSKWAMSVYMPFPWTNSIRLKWWLSLHV
jgi:hypothetical protein